MRTIRPLIALTVLAIVASARVPRRAALPAGADGNVVRRRPPPVPRRRQPDTSRRVRVQLGSNAIGPRDDAKIVRTGTIELEVKDVSRAQTVARDAIVALGGYVGASSTQQLR